MIGVKLFVTALLVLCISHLGESVRCYECQSDIHPLCADPFESKSVIPVRDCNTKQPPVHLLGRQAKQCSKTVRKIGQSEVFSRGCFFEQDEKEFGHCTNNPSDRNFDFKSCDVCEGELCNSAPKTFATVGALLAFVIASVFLV